MCEHCARCVELVLSCGTRVIFLDFVLLASMDIRKFLNLPSKRKACEDEYVENSKSDNGEFDPDELPDMVPAPKPSELRSTKAAKKKAYKLKLTYKCQWESKHPWVHCSNTQNGMFCRLCQAYCKPPGTARGA